MVTSSVAAHCLLDNFISRKVHCMSRTYRKSQYCATTNLSGRLCTHLRLIPRLTDHAIKINILPLLISSKSHFLSQYRLLQVLGSPLAFESECCGQYFCFSIKPPGPITHLEQINWVHDRMFLRANQSRKHSIRRIGRH